jgi:hypothetical protein
MHALWSTSTDAKEGIEDFQLWGIRSVAGSNMATGPPTVSVVHYDSTKRDVIGEYRCAVAFRCQRRTE